MCEVIHWLIYFLLRSTGETFDDGCTAGGHKTQWPTPGWSSMDSDEDFKHYSSCYYDEDDADRAFYPETAQRRLQLDSKSWFVSDKPVATGILQHTQQCPPQQLMLDNIVTSSDKLCTGKNVDRWNSNTRLSKDLPCDIEANSQQSVSIRFLHLHSFHT